MNANSSQETIKAAVRQAYGSVARRYIDTSDQHKQENINPQSCCGVSEVAVEKSAPVNCCGTSQEESENITESSCCTTTDANPPQQSDCCGPINNAVDVTDAVSKFYMTEDLADLPGSVTEASLGCGNPTAIAGLQPGEVVLDLGSGGGIDCFIAAKKVGPEGKVIGLDMTPDMITLARRNAKKIGVKNVDFRYGEMEDIPLPDDYVDLIISNCVINLSPDKDAVFREAYRVLRPGGRLSVSDIVTDGELPAYIRDQMDSWAGCVAGALEKTAYLDKLRGAGFVGVEIESLDYLQAKVVTAEDEKKVNLNECGCLPDNTDVRICSARIIAHKTE